MNHAAIESPQRLRLIERRWRNMIDLIAQAALSRYLETNSRIERSFSGPSRPIVKLGMDSMASYTLGCGQRMFLWNALWERSYVRETARLVTRCQSFGHLRALSDAS